MGSAAAGAAIIAAAAIAKGELRRDLISLGAASSTLRG
jgi:hypothetical protein